MEITIRLDNQLALRLEQLAIALNCPEARLIVCAIRDCVELQSQQIQAISEALRDYRDGNKILVPHDEVMERQGARLRAQA